MKYLRRHIHDPKILTRWHHLAKHICSNTWVSSRKHARQTLCKLAGDPIEASLGEHVFFCWRNPTLSVTSNVSERFNRKIERAVSARYGMPSEQRAKGILRSVWLKEVLLKGQQHLEATSDLRSLDVSSMCQEPFDTGNSLHFFRAYCPALADKLG